MPDAASGMLRQAVSRRASVQRPRYSGDDGQYVHGGAQDVAVVPAGVAARGAGGPLAVPPRGGDGPDVLDHLFPAEEDVVVGEPEGQPAADSGLAVPGAVVLVRLRVRVILPAVAFDDQPPDPQVGPGDLGDLRLHNHGEPEAPEPDSRDGFGAGLRTAVGLAEQLKHRIRQRAHLAAQCLGGYPQLLLDGVAGRDPVFGAHTAGSAFERGDDRVDGPGPSAHRGETAAGGVAVLGPAGRADMLFRVRRGDPEAVTPQRRDTREHAALLDRGGDLRVVAGGRAPAFPWRRECSVAKCAPAVAGVDAEIGELVAEVDAVARPRLTFGEELCAAMGCCVLSRCGRGRHMGKDAARPSPVPAGALRAWRPRAGGRNQSHPWDRPGGRGRGRR